MLLAKRAASPLRGLKIDSVGVNGCIPFASAPEVHVLPGRGRQRRARGGCGVFPWGRRRRRNGEDLEALASINDPRLSTNTHGHQTNDPRWDEMTLLYQCNVWNYLVDALVPTLCWVRCTHCSDYEAQGASGNYKARGASGNYEARGASGDYKARGASGGKYKA